MKNRRSVARATLALLSLLLVLGSLLPASAGAAKPGRGHVDGPLRKRAAEQPGQLIPVIVHRSSAGAAADALRKHAGRNERRLKTGHAVAADVPADKIEALAAEPGVTRVQLDPPVKVLAKPEQVARGLETVYPLAVRSAALSEGDRPLRGTGIGMAVLDSGIDENVDFHGATTVGRNERPGANRLIKRVAIKTDAQGGPGDDNGHGTYVAGIVGGRGWGSPNSVSDDGRYVGVAPDVNLISIKIADRNGMSRTSDVIRGIEWAVENKQAHNIRVLTLSLQSAMAEPYTTGLLNAAVEMAWFKGIVVVASSGNGGPNTLYYPPANDPYVITVGATDDQGTASVEDDRLASFSSYGRTQRGHSKPDLVAPGRRIVSVLSNTRDPLARQFSDRITDGRYIRLSGTSASAPIVAGVVAQILQARPELTPNEVKWLLQRTARPVPGVGTGAGYPQAAAAVAYRGPIGRANQGLVPNRIVALVGYAHLTGRTSIAWDSIGWDSIGWDSIGWDSIGWDSIGWDSIGWDSIGWDSIGWDSIGWDSIGWDTTVGD